MVCFWIWYRYILVTFISMYSIYQAYISLLLPTTFDHNQQARLRFLGILVFCPAPTKNRRFRTSTQGYQPRIYLQFRGLPQLWKVVDPRNQNPKAFFGAFDLRLKPQTFKRSSLASWKSAGNTTHRTCCAQKRFPSRWLQAIWKILIKLDHFLKQGWT